MVEHPAVNGRVVGSNPTSGVFAVNVDFIDDNHLLIKIKSRLSSKCLTTAIFYRLFLLRT